MNSIKIERLIRLSLMALAITPLIVAGGILFPPNTLFPFIFGKAVFIRLMMAIMGVLFAVGIFSKRGDIKMCLSRLANSLTITQLIFIFLTLVSTVLAFNPFRAFWGDIERSEGFLILIYMLLFFLGILLFFNKKDWLVFFKINLIVGGLVMADAIFDWIKGDIRPDGSFLGNTTFTALYGLFVIFFAMMVGTLERSKSWIYTSQAVAIASVVTIFLTKTRGVIIGLVVALLITLIYLVFTRKKISFGGFKARKPALIILSIIVLILTSFVFTRGAPLWQQVPGLDRLAKISYEDATTQTRLINLGISLSAINPANVGINRTLLGWGPEGYINAHNQFYDSSIQKYENAWFDRAHNKILDVLAMNGILGLLAYLSLWIVLFRNIFFTKPRGEGEEANKDSLISLSIGAIATAYFVQNLFLFDQAAMYVPLFSLFAFATYHYYGEKGQPNGEHQEVKYSLASKVVSMLLAGALVWLFIWTSIIPVIQMNEMVAGFNEGSFDEARVNKITTPNNFIQSEMRLFMLFNLIDRLPPEQVIENFPLLIPKGEETLKEANNKARIKQEMGVIYSAASKIFQPDKFLAKGETHLREGLELAPGRQAISFILAENLILQGKFEQAEKVMKEALEDEPNAMQIDVFYISTMAPYDFDGRLGTLERLKELYLEEGKVIDDIALRYIREGYSNYLSYSYRVKDSFVFTTTLSQAIKTEKILREIIDSQLADSMIESTADTREETLSTALSTFNALGWDGIRLQ